MRSNRTRGQGQRVQKVKEFRSSKGHVFTKKTCFHQTQCFTKTIIFTKKNQCFHQKKKFSATTTKNKVVIKNHVLNKKKFFNKKCSHLKTCFHQKHVFTKRTCFYHITSQTLRLLTESTQWADLVKIKRAWSFVPPSWLVTMLLKSPWLWSVLCQRVEELWFHNTTADMASCLL